MGYDLMVVKRDGRLHEFNKDKITDAIVKALIDLYGEKEEGFNELATNLMNKVYDEIILKYIGRGLDSKIRHTMGKELTDDSISYVTVEEIQDVIIDVLKNEDQSYLAVEYEKYRTGRSKIREYNSGIIKTIQKIAVHTDRDNANVGNNFSAKLLRMASEVNKVANLAMMPKKFSKLHENGDIYYHDLDSYNLTINCLHNDTKAILKRGFNTGYGDIKEPKRIESATALSCILLQGTQNK